MVVVRALVLSWAGIGTGSAETGPMWPLQTDSSAERRTKAEANASRRRTEQGDEARLQTVNAGPSRELARDLNHRVPTSGRGG